MKLFNNIDKKKFLIQIVIAILISIFFQFVLDPFVYDPYVRESIRMLAGDAIVITSLSMWFFSFSFAYLFYPDNEILSNYILCGFIPLLIIVGVEFFALHMFYDFLHIPPIIVSIYIILKKYTKIQLKTVGIISALLMIWAAIVRLVGTNYTSVSLFPEGLVVVILWPLLNLLMAFIIRYVSNKWKK